ncbi:MAG: hypothetical protein H6684_00520 [Deltaproteobacteria bacterium]|nr:hypothetical protein [Deltaproteobacteria bacterium]MCB9478254.1 hypothetical protein [Deltaproteobacteria bacterium]MCB9487193.1 hypothetical protein [Deltaproteobacteria bacterium]
MRRRWATLKAMAVIGLARLTLRLPDPVLVRVLGATHLSARIVGVSSKNRGLILEIQDIFRRSGFASATLRRMLTDGDPRRLRFLVRGAFLR